MVLITYIYNLINFNYIKKQVLNEAPSPLAIKIDN